MKIGTRFERSVHLGAESISSFARAAGDQNPVHHDEELARATRFGDLVFLAGRVRTADGEDAVKAVGKVLLVDRL